MRKKNGFTLVEIISVIGILLLITAVTIPSIATMNNRNKEKEYNRIVENIKTSSENFIERYRYDIPFNENNEYYFKLNVLGALNLIKLPITNPINNEKISEDTCIKVTREEDWSLSYELLNKSCPNSGASTEPGNTTKIEKPTIEIDSSLVYLKQNSNISDINLKSYIKSYSSGSTPKRYLDVVIDDSKLNTTSIGTKTVSYQAIDLLYGGIVSDIVEKSFYVFKDPKIKVVFLSDTTTKQNLTSAKLSTFASGLASELESKSPYKSGGIKYQISTTTVSSTVGAESYVIDYDYEKLGACASVDTEYLGVIGNTVVIRSPYKNNYCGSDKHIFVNIDTGAISTISYSGDKLECKMEDINNIYCNANDDGGTNSQTWRNHDYFHYVLKDGKYELNAEYNYDYSKTNNRVSESYEPSEDEFLEVEEKYANLSEEWNTHVNPTGQTTPFTSSSKLRNFLEDTMDIDDTSDYYYDNFENVFSNNEKGIGYLFFDNTSTKYTTYGKVRMLWKSQTETFNINLNNYTSGYDRVYFVVTANNTNNYVQSVTISNPTSAKNTYIYADANSLNKFSISPSTKTTFTSIDNALTHLKQSIITKEGSL